MRESFDVVVSADGSTASAETSGGGSGGSVFFISDEMDFHGEVHADGGMVLVLPLIDRVGRRSWRWRRRWRSDHVPVQRVHSHDLARSF